MTRPGQSNDLLEALAVSGGGTRAAALGYGVLEELRRTDVTVNGVKRRPLDEADVISAVSGGTLPAAYPESDRDRSPEPPDTDTLEGQMRSIPVDRISFDAVEQVREQLAARPAAGSREAPACRRLLDDLK